MSDSRGEATGPTYSRRTVLQSIGSATVAAGGIGAIGAASGTTTPSPLATDGRFVVDATGARFRPRGVSTASVTLYAHNWHGRSVRDVVRHATDLDRGWHANHVRLPVTQRGIDEFGLDAVVTDMLRPAVDALADRGVYALIDCHLTRPYTEDGVDTAEAQGYGPYDRATDTLVRSFWERVAPAFAGDDNVVFELFNEPTYPVWWADDAGVWSEWRQAAQPWVDLVQNHAPARPLVIGSPRWCSTPNPAPDDPFAGSNLIYAGHIYPTAGQPSEFDSVYGAPANDVPIWITEFGWDPDGSGAGNGTTTGWGQPFRTWVEGYENVGWTAYCFDDAWRPSMFTAPDDDHAPWTMVTGSEELAPFVQDWLAATTDRSGDGSGSGTETPTATATETATPPDTPTDEPIATPTDTPSGCQAPTAPAWSDGTTPHDVDADGVYEDLNGNCEFDSDDVVTYFQEIDRAGIQQNPSYYDANGNGNADFDDIVVLFQQL